MRLLTGIQSTAAPHLGNLLGAIIPAIEKSKEQTDKPYYFIADMHSLTTVTDAEKRMRDTYSVAATWIAFGCDKDNTTLYRQSQIPQVSELAWYLMCFIPTSMLLSSHAYETKLAQGEKPKAGLLNYPCLMAADILLYNSTHVPVGKDQQQHLDITRDVARSMNFIYDDLFQMPEALISSEVMVPGIDGGKMSKSKNNVIDIFQSDKELKKAVMRIQTDSTLLENPKKPDTCTVFQLYKLIASPDQSQELKTKYTAGGFGYGDAKRELYELIIDKFGEQRECYHQLMSDTDQIDDILSSGENEARLFAEEKMTSVRERLGFLPRRSGLSS